MAVHYKFKSSRDYATVNFEGGFISLGEFKKAVISQKKLGKLTDFDLVVTNAQTNEEYADEKGLIPKNTSLVIKRVPAAVGNHNSNSRASLAAPDHSLNDDISSALASHTSEADRMNSIVSMGGGQWHMGSREASVAAKKPTRPYLSKQDTSPIPPPGYICHRCKQKGHYIQNCPTNDDPKFNFAKPLLPTGIPRSKLKKVDAAEAGNNALSLPDGGFAVMEADSANFDRRALQLGAVKISNVPENLQCGVCKGLLKDAVVLTCCGKSCCDDCIRDLLLKRNQLTCPLCNYPNCSPDALVVSKKLRKAVQDYVKNVHEADNESAEGAEDKDKLRKGRKCYVCGEFGHLAKLCPTATNSKKAEGSTHNNPESHKRKRDEARDPGPPLQRHQY